MSDRNASAVDALLAALRRAADMLSAVAGDLEDGGDLGSVRAKYVGALVTTRDNIREVVREATIRRGCPITIVSGRVWPTLRRRGAVALCLECGGALVHDRDIVPVMHVLPEPLPPERAG